MHSATLPVTPPRARSSDLLGLTLFLAAAVHAIIILGVSFVAFDKKRLEAPPALEVILVQSKSATRPDQADYLAQVNQEGGGDVQEKMRPSSPFANATSRNERGTAPQTQPLQAPPPQAAAQQHNVLTTERKATLRAQIRESQQNPATSDATPAAQLIPPSQEVARLAAEISKSVQNYATMPRHKYITASTHEYLAASYEYGWRLKVERVGNLNYPDEAKRQNLSGDLMLDVAINADGTLNGVKVVRPSGSRVLDEGAVRIVNLAAPYAPLPPALRKEADVLHIIRTWQFRSDNRLETSR